MFYLGTDLGPCFTVTKQVYVNEKYFTTFDYRCDHCDICHLTVNGDVELMDVELMDPLVSACMNVCVCVCARACARMCVCA